MGTLTFVLLKRLKIIVIFTDNTIKSCLPENHTKVQRYLLFCYLIDLIRTELVLTLIRKSFSLLNIFVNLFPGGLMGTKYLDSQRGFSPI